MHVMIASQQLSQLLCCSVVFLGQLKALIDLNLLLGGNFVTVSFNLPSLPPFLLWWWIQDKYDVTMAISPLLLPFRMFYHAAVWLCLYMDSYRKCLLRVYMSVAHQEMFLGSVQFNSMVINMYSVHVWIISMVGACMPTNDWCNVTQCKFP